MKACKFSRRQQPLTDFFQENPIEEETNRCIVNVHKREIRRTGKFVFAWTMIELLAMAKCLSS